MSTRKPTISDLAQAAGVSKTTVSHAFSGRRHVDPETRRRIETIAHEMGYRPSRAAQHLRSGRTGVIALASSMPFAVAAGPSRLGFLMEIAASAAVASLTRNMALCLVPPLGDDGHLDALSPDGAILVEPFADDPLVRHFAEAHVPIVTIGRAPGRDDLPHVDIRSGATARLVLDHLLGEGARRPALVTGTQPRTSYAETRAVYAEICGSFGVPDVQLALDEAGGEALAEAEIAALLQAHPDTDALFVPVDAFATGAVRAAAKLGRAVPRDLKIATRYDGLRAKLSQPPLTAVDLHLDEISDLAVSLMLDAIEGRSPGPVASPAAELVVRESTRGGGLAA